MLPVRTTLPLLLLALPALAGGCRKPPKPPAASAPSAQVAEGDRLAQSGDLQAAIERWEQAARTAPGDPVPVQRIAEALLQNGQSADAVRALEEARRRAPDAAQTTALLAQVTLRAGDNAGAARQAQEALARDPTNRWALTTLAAARYRLGDMKEQVRALRALIALDPEDTVSLAALATSFVAQRRWNDLDETARKILAVEDKHADAYLWRGMAGFYIAATDEALARAEADLKTSLRLAPNRYLPHLMLGRIHRRQRRFPAAIAHLSAAAKLRPGRQDAYFDLMAVYLQENRKSDAEAARRRYAQALEKTARLEARTRACRKRPDDFALHKETGLLALELDEIRTASEMLRRAQALRRDDAPVNAALQSLARRIRGAGAGL